MKQNKTVVVMDDSDLGASPGAGRKRRIQYAERKHRDLSGGFTRLPNQYHLPGPGSQPGHRA